MCYNLHECRHAEVLYWNYFIMNLLTLSLYIGDCVHVCYIVCNWLYVCSVKILPCLIKITSSNTVSAMQSDTWVTNFFVELRNEQIEIHVFHTVKWIFLRLFCDPYSCVVNVSNTTVYIHVYRCVSPMQVTRYIHIRNCWADLTECCWNTSLWLERQCKPSLSMMQQILSPLDPFICEEMSSKIL